MVTKKHNHPKKGYTKGNVVLSSRVANYMKHDLSIEDFQLFSEKT